MAIDDEHPEYAARAPEWKKLRDVAAGQEAIHAARCAYLPKLTDQTDDDYKAYLCRTPFYEATSRTIDGLSGMVFRKEPQVEVPPGMEAFLDDITLDGTSLLGVAETLVDDDITVARAGILVDHPSIMANTSVADAERMNLRPFMKCYSAESIFNWKVESRNNAQVLTQVRLWECVVIPGSDEFDSDTRIQIRVLDLNEVGQYRQRVFIKVKFPTGREDWIQDGPDIVPLKGGVPLDVIPFWFIGVKHGSATCEKPPLLGLANINISHYQSTADLEHGAHFTGLPTAVITGHSEDEDGESYRIGSSTAWVFPNAETQVQYLEFQGQGLEALEKRIAKKEEQMSFLGARMLSPDTKGVEAAETAQIHRMGEMSVLASLAGSVSQSIEKALRFMCDWAGFPSENVTFELNKDFIAIPMTADQLNALMAAWQQGGIAYKDLLDILKAGEIVSQDRTEEDIRSEVEIQNPFQNVDPAMDEEVTIQ